MPRNSSGDYSLVRDWVADKANGVMILASRMMSQENDIATALTGSLARDGTGGMLANLNMNSHRINSVLAGVLGGDCPNITQIQNNQFKDLGISEDMVGTPTGEGYLFNPVPAFTSFEGTQFFQITIHETNTIVDPEFQIGTISPIIPKKFNASGGYISLEIGDLMQEKIYLIKRDYLNGEWLILNPEKPYFNGKNLVDVIGSVPQATTTTEGKVFIPERIILSNNTLSPNSKIDFSDGNYSFDDGSGLAIFEAQSGDLTQPFGTSDGMLDTGSVAPSTVYYIFAIYDSGATTPASKPLASTSKTSPVMPTGYDKKRYIGAIRTDASGNIVRFTQKDKRFIYDSPQLLYGTTTGTIGTQITTTSGFNISTKIPNNSIGIFNVYYCLATGITNNAVLFCNPSNTNKTVNEYNNFTVNYSTPGSSQQSGSFEFQCDVDSSSNLYCQSLKANETRIQLICKGFIDENII